MEKPVVKYDERRASHIALDERASVYALNHPRFGRQRISTSMVILINEDDSFETLNTIYQPIGEQNAN